MQLKWFKSIRDFLYRLFNGKTSDVGYQNRYSIPPALELWQRLENSLDESEKDK